MKILVFGDSLSTLKPESDTGLAFAYEALQRNHEVFWGEKTDFLLKENQVFCNSKKILSFQAGEIPKTEDPSQMPLRDWDTVWIRKDPPFDSSYLSICWLLALYEHQTLILNRPSQLCRYHEKMLPYEALHQGAIEPGHLIPTLMATNELPFGEVEQSLPDSKERLTKPWLGHGGSRIEKWKKTEVLLHPYTLIQPFLPEVTQNGDQRVFFLDGDYVGHLTRIPKKGSIESNLSQGGRAEIRPFSENEIILTEKLSQFLKAIGIFFAGADYLEGKLTEINITAPTGVLALKKLSEKNLAEAFVRAVEDKLKK